MAPGLRAAGAVAPGRGAVPGVAGVLGACVAGGCGTGRGATFSVTSDLCTSPGAAWGWPLASDFAPGAAPDLTPDKAPGAFGFSLILKSIGRDPAGFTPDLWPCCSPICLSSTAIWRGNVYAPSGL